MSNLVRVKFWLRSANGKAFVSPQTRPRFVQKFDLFKQQMAASYSTGNGVNTRGYSSRMKWFWMPAGVGFALISFLQLRHIFERERRKQNWNTDANEVGVKAIAPWQVTLFKVVPTRVLSRLWGEVNDIELPGFLLGPAIRFWTWAFDCCLEDAEEEDVSKYPNLGAFFTRKLKPGARVIDKESELVSVDIKERGNLEKHPGSTGDNKQLYSHESQAQESNKVCPVDGRVLHFGCLVDGKVEQVKGVPYSLETFIGPKSTFAHPNHDIPKSPGKQLFHCVLYLGPGDCHHFHSPTEWSVEARRHFSGQLYSVSPSVLKGFKDVLSTNERVALFGRWKYGAFTMTAVGAYNVGSIAIHFDEELHTNMWRANKGDFNEKVFAGKSNISLSRGDRVGWFAMGSAVVLVFEAPSDFEFCVQPGQKVMLGEPLGNVVKRKS